MAAAHLSAWRLADSEMDKSKTQCWKCGYTDRLCGSLVLTAVYLLFADGIIAMFGGTVNEETFHYSQEYFFYITLGIPFYMFGQAMNPIIRADGNPKFAMFSTLAGAVINIILDPIFIFVCKWGMMGAAVATVIGQVRQLQVLAVWYLLAYENHQTDISGLCSADGIYVQTDADAGHYQLPVSDQPGGSNGGNQQYAS